MPYDGTWSRFPGQHRRGRAGHWRHAGSLTRAVPAALVLPRTGSSVDVDILVRQDLTNTHASELFSNQWPNSPGDYECTNGRAEHVEALHFAIGQPTATSARALGSKDAPEIHTCGRRMSCVPVLTKCAKFLCMQVDWRADEVLIVCFKLVGEALGIPDARWAIILAFDAGAAACSCCREADSPPCHH